MLRIALVLGLTTLATLLPAQEPETPEAPAPVVLSLAPRWKVGDSYTLEFTKTRQQVQGKREAKVMGTITPVQVEVLEEHEDGYTVRWTYGESEFVGGDSQAKSVMDKLANLFQGAALDLRTDEYGTPNALLNEEQVREKVEDLFSDVTELAIAEGASPQQMEQVIDATREMLAGPTLATSVLKDPQIFYFACGMQLTLGELQEFDELLPNPFGGEPFPGSSQLLLESVDEAANRAVVIHRLQLDPEEARRVMLETFIKLAADTGSPTPRASDLPDFSIVDESEYDLDLVTNLPRSLTHVRTVSAAGSSQIDRLAFRILPPPAESTDEAAGEDE